VPSSPNQADLEAAHDSGSSSTDNITNVVMPTFSGFTEADSIVELFDGATSIGSVTTNGVAYSVTSTVILSDGAHAITGKATDVAGNVSGSNVALNVTIDTAASAGITLPSEGQDKDPGQLPIVGTAGDELLSVTVNAYTGSTATGTPLFTGNSSPVMLGGWFASLGPFNTAGTYCLQATYTDAAGNVAASAVRTFTV
jgi:large repetitive protein